MTLQVDRKWGMPYASALCPLIGSGYTWVYSKICFASRAFGSALGGSGST